MPANEKRRYGMTTEYRRIYRRKVLPLSNQTSRYIRKCIRMKFHCISKCLVWPAETSVVSLARFVYFQNTKILYLDTQCFWCMNDYRNKKKKQLYWARTFLCLFSAHCSSTDGFILLQYFRSVVWHPRDLHVVPVQSSTQASILHKSTAGRYRPVSYPDGPITARYRFM